MLNLPAVCLKTWGVANKRVSRNGISKHLPLELVHGSDAKTSTLFLSLLTENIRTGIFNNSRPMSLYICPKVTNVQIPFPSRKSSREIPIAKLTVPVRNIIRSSQKVRNWILQPAKLDRVNDIQQTTVKDANSSQPIPFLSSDLNRFNTSAGLTRDTQLARAR